MKKMILAFSVFFTIIFTLSYFMPESAWAEENKTGAEEKVETTTTITKENSTTVSTMVICNGKGKVSCTSSVTQVTTKITTL